MIIAAAVKLADGRVFVGKRHSDCFQHIREILKLEVEQQAVLLKDHIQGFINDQLMFKNRTEAYYEAFEAGQCKEQKDPRERNKDGVPYKTVLFGIEVKEWQPSLCSEQVW